MSTKKSETTAGAVGGYLRVSLIVFPPECRGAEERAAFVDTLRQIRKAELQREAAQQGETITAWYDDLGVSGRGEFYPKRVAFSRARRDAKEGRLRSLYARDLSRLFRNVVQQELWFAEMEDLGVTVHAQDLPFAADAATRRLLRQQMGVIHEYVSSRMGSLIRERTRTRLLNGLGVGLSRSVWGLRYSPDEKAYEFDADTADRVRLLFETYVDCGGVASHAAKRLNLLLVQAHPRATPTPTGKLWNSQLVLSLLRCSLYRRAIQYEGRLIPAPERVPAVVPPELAARADALLKPRSDRCAGAYAKRSSGLQGFTYTGLIRCGYCGRPMHARPRVYGASDAETGWVSYLCRPTPHNQHCTNQYSVQQRRINLLVGRGLRTALGQAPEESGGPSLGTLPGPVPEGGARPSAPMGSRPGGLDGALGNPADAVYGPQTPAARALQEALARLDRKRDRYLELFAAGVIQDRGELDRHLERVALDQGTLQIPWTPGCLVRGGTARTAAGDEVARMRAEFLSVWPYDWNTPLDVQKHDLLVRMRASVSIRILPHATKKPGKTDRPRHNGGRLTLTLDLPVLGLTGWRALQLAETDDDLRRYWLWRGDCTRPTKPPSAGEAGA